MKKRKFGYSLFVGVGLLAFGVPGLASCSSAGSSFKVASVGLNKTELTMQVGDVEVLSARITKGYDASVRWFTSNENVAYVEEGYVFATGEGTAVITVAFAGGYADCLVTVSGTGGGGDIGDRIFLSPSTKKVTVGETFTITYRAAEGVTVTYSSEKPEIATVTADGIVTAVGVGATIIKAVGSNGKLATCSVVVSEGGSGGGGGDVDEDLQNLGYSGELTIGSPLIQKTFMEGLLADFNRLTNSNITFTVTQFEESNGTSGYGDAKSMPAVFPYASDQTLTLYQFNALSDVSRSHYNWIKKNMGDDAYNAAKLISVVGYPFCADNGVVMFYDKSVLPDASVIDTVPKLLQYATDYDMEINYQIGNEFLAAGALMSYAPVKNDKKVSFYKLNPTNSSYTSTSAFSCAEGIQGARLVRDIITHDQVRPATAAPTNGVLVTITDVSKVRSFKERLGSNYGVAPLPYADDTRTARLGSFLGYKFYGVNNTLSSSDKTKAAAVAKFLCSEYAQKLRFQNYATRPTLTSLAPLASSEPHVAALMEQEKNGGTVPLTAISTELWSQSGTAVTSIKALGPSASDAEYKTILDLLDSQLTKTE